MTIWLIRAGFHGEYEQKFIQENRVYVTWDGLNKKGDDKRGTNLLFHLFKLGNKTAGEFWGQHTNPDERDKCLSQLIFL